MVAAVTSSPIRLCAGLLVLMMLVFVPGAAPAAAQVTPRAVPDSVRDYVSAAMTVFRERSVHRDSVDWAALEDSVLARARRAQTPAETWLALTWALRRVDPHSFLRPPDAMLGAFTGGLVPQAPAPVERGPLGRLVDGDIGLVVVPAHAGLNRTAYVDSLHAQLHALDGEGVCGWVVDLRENTGGNMWPMVAGIGPLLGDSVVGSFTISPPGTGWRYRDGRSWHGDGTAPAEPAGRGTHPPRTLDRADAPVAILIGRETASSGEMVLIAFQGRPDVRTFGDSTAGYASSNSSVPLRDGAIMMITSSYPLDRLGRRYPLRIAPDEPVAANAGGEGDPVLQRAVGWLRRQAACSAVPGRATHRHE